MRLLRGFKAWVSVLALLCWSLLASPAIGAKPSARIKDPGASRPAPVARGEASSGGGSDLLVRALDLRFNLRISEQALTTEKVWELEPEQFNAHRQAWVLSPQMSLERLEAVPRGKGVFGAEALSIRADVVGMIRPPGPFFDTIDDLDSLRKSPLLKRHSTEIRKGSLASCPIPEGFLTREQAASGLQAEADLLERTLSQRRVDLAERMARIAAPTPSEAKLRAKMVFESWWHDVEILVRSQSEAAVREAKEKFLKAVLSEHASKACFGAKRGSRSQRESLAGNRSESGVGSRSRRMGTPIRGRLQDSDETPGAFAGRMDPLIAAQEHPTLGRAPAKQVAGGLAARARICVGSKSITGLFLLDLTQAQSLVSPMFLREQGVQPWEVPTVGRGAEWIPDALEVGGYAVPLRYLKTVETVDWVRKSKSEQMQLSFLRAGCCSGVFGADLLAFQTLEIGTGGNPYFRLLPRTHFHAGSKYTWIEASLVEEPGPVASRLRTQCWWRQRPESSPQPITVLWESAEPEKLNAPGGFPGRGGRRQKNSKPDSTGKGTLICAEDIQWPLNPADYRLDGGKMVLRASFWMSKGPLVMDLPNGRIWIRPTGAPGDSLPR